MALFGKKEEANANAEEQQRKQAEELVKQFSAALDEKLKPIIGDVQSLKGKWDEIEKEADRERQEASRRKTEEQNANLTDEQKNAQQLLAATQAAVIANSRHTENEVISEVASQWPGAVISDIKDYFSKTPVGRKAQADYAEYCRNIVDMVVGKAARKGGLSFDSQKNSFYLESERGKTSESKHSSFDTNDFDYVRTKKDGVVTVEKGSETLRKLGINPEEFEADLQKGVV